MDASWSLYRCVISWFLSLHLLVGQKTSNSKWKRFSGFIVFLAIIWVLQELTTVKILRYVILFIGKLSIKVPSFSFIFKLKTGFTLQVWWTAYSQFTVCVTFSLILWTSIKKILILFWLQWKIRYIWWSDITESPLKRCWEVCRDLSLLHWLWLGCHLVRFF